MATETGLSDVFPLDSRLNDVFGHSWIPDQPACQIMGSIEMRQHDPLEFAGAFSLVH